MKKQTFTIAIIISLLTSSTAFAKNVKTISIDESEVAQVRVSPGYSTLLQFDARPVQAIVGDQDSFKVEYVGNSIAIKPLMSGVSTNLFVMTEYGKFNFRISSGRGFEPDYILRVKKNCCDD
ncbi:MAG: TrbG/VirB9 family P-type conjugative transfer protein [Bdellovibrionales bacterium]|nr:TrbG/VirB9 family P-type conjugative transfer protein [Bdellovibrionales bacterium]